MCLWLCAGHDLVCHCDSNCGKGGMPCTRATVSLAVCCCDCSGLCATAMVVLSMLSMTVLDLPSRQPVLHWLWGVINIESTRPHNLFPALVVGL